MDDEGTEAVGTGTDRRSALKKAAIAAGVVAWTTPAVQAVTGRAAHAQTITGCSPVFTATALLTGSNCKNCPGVPDDESSCCSKNTYFVAVAVTCGSTCPGTATITNIDISGGTKPSAKCDNRFRDEICKGSTQALTITADVKCPDGTTFNKFSQTITVDCKICGPEPETTTTTKLGLQQEPGEVDSRGSGDGGGPQVEEEPTGEDAPPSATTTPTPTTQAPVDGESGDDSESDATTTTGG